MDDRDAEIERLRCLTEQQADALVAMRRERDEAREQLLSIERAAIGSFLDDLLEEQ